jgi:hypothetical protein
MGTSFFIGSPCFSRGYQLVALPATGKAVQIVQGQRYFDISGLAGISKSSKNKWLPTLASATKELRVEALLAR